jgi:hypothetical protein
MKGYKFYLEYPSNAAKKRGTTKAPGDHSGNAIAIYGDIFYSGGKFLLECISAIYFNENSQVCGSAVSLDYLQERCKRIPESLARKIHPALFERLDSAD